MSSRRAIRRQMCGNKVRFASLKEALAARRNMAVNGANVTRLNAYRCRYCGFFHLGHIPAGILYQISQRMEARA
jgi:hypothetical protein